MRQLYLQAPTVLKLREIDDPVASAGELIVEVRGATTCGTDLKTFRRGHPKFPMPTPFGHEFSGVVSEVGSGLSDRFSVGDEIMSAPTAPCQECPLCRRGLPNLCPTCMDRLILGAFAEKVRIPAHIVAQNVYRKPPEIDFYEAALMEPLACAVYGQQMLGSLEGKTVAIIGAGPIGLLHQMLASRQNPEKLIVLGRRAARLQLSESIGADLVIDTDQVDDLDTAISQATSHRGADVLIECTGQAGVWQASIRATAPGGITLLFGGCPGGTQVDFPMDEIWRKALTVLGVFHFTPEAVAEARRHLSSGLLPVKHLITEIRPMSDFENIFRDLGEGKAVKYGIMPWC